MGPLGDGPYGIELIVHLVKDPSVDSDQIPLYLPGHNQYRRRCGISRANAGSGVEQARAWNYHSRPYSAPCTGKTVGHVGGSLLMPGRYQTNAGLVVKGVQSVVKLHARQAEYDPHTLAV